jgi:hypothetical protein
MRQLFRMEYARELEETQVSLEIEPGEPPLRAAASSTISTPTNLPTMPGGTMTETLPRMGPRTEPPTEPDPHRTGGGDRPRGFWAALFKKRK